MDRKNDDGHSGTREAIADDEPTNERPALDLETLATNPLPAPAYDNVVDPNVLALRRVDAEIRRLMESWVDLESRLNDRNAEIRRLRDQSRTVEAEVQATRQELGSARADCERLRGEAANQRAQAEAEKRRQDEHRQHAEKLQLDLVTARARIDELSAELVQDKGRRTKLETQLTEHRDAVAGMAAQLHKFEKANHGNDDEKAALAARIADMDRQGMELQGRWRDAKAATRHAEQQLLAATSRAEGLEKELRQAHEVVAGLEKKLEEKAATVRSLQAETLRIGELQRALNAERDNASALRKQITTGTQAVKQMETSLEHQRQKTEAAENTVSRTEQLLADNRENFLATIAERDLTIAGLRERASGLEAERARLIAQLDEQAAKLSAVDSDFQAKRKAIAALGTEFDRLGLIQANVRKLDGMMNQQLFGSGEANGEAEPVRNNTRLIVSLDGEKAAKYPLFKPDMVIGRARDTDIRVSGPHTSRRHARVFINDDVVMIEDLGSLNGITVNDKAVRKHELHNGDILDVGGARLRFVDLRR